jgi:hypothetical protein
MPPARQYADVAAKQRAYRQRQKVAGQKIPDTVPTAPVALWKHWRARLQAIKDELDLTAEAMHSYAQERSERWTDSDAGAAFEQDINTLEELSSDMENLNIWSTGT